MTALINIITLFALQVDPNKGTLQAMQDAKQRLTEPHLYDMVFPLIALLLVIIIPSCVAAWVAYKTITDKTLVDGEA